MELPNNLNSIYPDSIIKELIDLKHNNEFNIALFLNKILPYLKRIKDNSMRDWAYELFDYAVFKSFPHKKSNAIDFTMIEVYEITLGFLSYINGNEFLNYDYEKSSDYDKFKKTFLSSYMFEIMQLDMFLYKRNTLEHVMGVKNVAMHIALQLKELGLPIDLNVVLASSLGHDIGKYGVSLHEQERVPYLHYYYTQYWFEKNGMEKIGHIASNHSTWDLELETLPLESLVLIYSDFRVKNVKENNAFNMKILTLDESFEVVLNKLDDLTEQKKKRYEKVFAKLKDFEDYLKFMAVDTTLSGQLGQKKDQYICLLDGNKISKTYKYKSIENNIHLMSNLINEENFLEILETARGEEDWRRLRIYLQILREYSTYLTQRQKEISLRLLKDLLLHKEEDIRKESSEIIGKIVANFDEEYRKELPKDIAIKINYKKSEQIFSSLLDDLLFPDYKIVESQNEWLYNLKTIVKSIFLECKMDYYQIYFDSLSRFYSSSQNLPVLSQFYLTQTISYIPINSLDQNRYDIFIKYLHGNLNSPYETIRISTLDKCIEIIDTVYNESYNEFLRHYLINNSSKSNSNAENYLKFILSEKLKLSPEIKQSLKNSFETDNSDISEIFLENLKTATGWIYKKINIDILYDQVKKNPVETGMHAAIHFCNLLKVSAIEKVRNYSGHTLLSIFPMLSLEQRNDVTIELLRALEMDNYQFTKFIPNYLGRLVLFLPPKELDEIIDDLEDKVKTSEPQTCILLFKTIGIAIENYYNYKNLFFEDIEINSRRLNRLFSLLLIPLSSYKDELKTESLTVISNNIFSSKNMPLQEKRLLFTKYSKKLLTLMDDKIENNYVFYSNAASFNKIYKYILECEYEKLDLSIESFDKIAFFPGAFDPFSLSHRQIAKEIRKLGFEVFLAVDEFSWSKRTEAHQYRRNIINMTVSNEDGIYLFPSDIPINLSNERDLKLLKEVFINKEIYLAVGTDVILNASAYKMNKEILNFSHLIFDRRTSALPNFEEAELADAINKIKGKVIELSLPTQYEDISSTKIREYIDQNRDISKLIDPIAAEYIRNFKLYKREPLYKSLIETKKINVSIYRNLNDELVEYLINSFGSYINKENLLKIRDKLSYRIVVLKESNTSLPLAFSIFYWVRHSRLFEEFKDQNITEYIRENSNGRTAVISCLFSKDNNESYLDMVLNESLSIAINRDYNNCIYYNNIINGNDDLAQKYIELQGFLKTNFKIDDNPMYFVDMNNPISLNLDLENMLKSPYNTESRISNTINLTRNRLKKAIADLYPGNLVIAFSKDMIYSKLIQKVCDTNGVSVIDANKTKLGEKMCVPFGIILNKTLLPNTVTKTLHTEKQFSKDVENFTIRNFPNYLSLKEQCKVIKSFNRPVILVDDILHNGYRLQIVVPNLLEQEVKISKLLVGILSGRGKEIAELMNIDVDSAYFIPNLKLWVNESAQYPFLGGDMIQGEQSNANLLTSVNLLLPYVYPKYIEDSSIQKIYELSKICLENALLIFSEIEKVYQEINEKNLNINTLGEVLFVPRIPDIDQNHYAKNLMKPSDFIKKDLDYLKRLESPYN
ncbi:cytidyltransferase [Soehngenia longivitae]|uniref:nicotinate-nucleotide adenylyltransferase n=1 Tax=Soehngenia longivitae TaxID=2562294 RepID=A0A4Z0D3A8_9FIRM|nr:cytidyltransferase [Soehngenia longivitae]TFZ40230.1 cytidyltransferase [Soehngenia longivitae]